MMDFLTNEGVQLDVNFLATFQLWYKILFDYKDHDLYMDLHMN